MRTFVDNAGRTWTIVINVDAVRRVRALLKVNLLQAVEGKLIEQLVSDPVLLCDILFCLCQPEADPRGVTDEDFGRAMGGDAIDRATTAFLEELVDFFPFAKRRVLTKALAKLRKLEALALDHAEKRIDSLEAETQLQALLAAPRNSSGNAPESSASTPAPSPSAS